MKTMTKKQLIDTMASDDLTKKQLMAHTKKELEWALSLQATDDDTEVQESDESPVGGNAVPLAYRLKYAAMAKARGSKHNNNGDELALLLESADSVMTCGILDQLLDQPQGKTYASYTSDRVGIPHPKTGEPMKALNNGMVRMNAGNRIRGIIKKSDDANAKLAEVTVWATMVADGQAVA